MKYVAKSDTWFIAGKEVELVNDFRSENVNMGIFRGWRICEIPEAENRLLGEKYYDEEVCNFDEFEVVNE